MATSSIIQDEILTCTVCFEIFTEPKTLPCLHTFCEKCLSGYIRGKANAYQSKGFSCPVCREFISSPDPKRHPADWADLFKTNFHLKNLMKALDTASKSIPMRRRGKSCREHPEKDLDLFCVECSSAVCHLCAGISHRSCRLVITIQEAAGDRRAVLQATEDKLKSQMSAGRLQLENVKRIILRLDEQHTESQNNIKQLFSNLVRIVRKREAVLLQKLDEKHEALKCTVQNTLETFNEGLKSARQSIVAVDTLVTRGTDFEVIDKFAEFQDVKGSDVSNLQSLCSNLQNINLYFVPGASIKDASTRLENIGKVVLEQTSDYRKENVDTTEVSMSAGRPSAISKPIVPSRERKPMKVRTVSAKMRDDKYPPKLIDIVVLPGNSVTLVTDWINQCVKGFFSRRDKDCRLDVGGKPWCIAQLASSLVAVSLPLSQQICVLKVTNSLMLLSSVMAEKRYSGLAAIDRETLVASGGSAPPCVDIINIGGEVLQSFVKDSVGHALFSYPAYVCITPQGYILVSDRDRGSLTCLRRDGSVAWCFQPKGEQRLLEPGGVVCDRKGNVFFVEKRGVLKLVADGRYKGVALREKDGVDTPRGVFILNDQIFLTQKNEEIDVFNM